MYRTPRYLEDQIDLRRTVRARAGNIDEGKENNYESYTRIGLDWKKIKRGGGNKNTDKKGARRLEIYY